MKFLTIIISIFFLSLCSHARSIEDIQAAGEIVIAVYNDFPPYSYIDSNGEAKGIDIEIGKRIAESLNVKPKWYFTDAGEDMDGDLRNVVWKGNPVHKTRADVMMRIPYDYNYMRETDVSTGALRTDMVVIKSPYHSERWVIVTHKETIPSINTMGIFAYNTVGVELDTLPDKYLSMHNGGLLRKNVKRYARFQDAVKDFQDGKIDAIAGLQSQLEFLLDYEKNQDKYFMTKEILGIKSKWDLGIAVRMDAHELSNHIDGVISQLYQDNTLKSIFDQYHVTYNIPISISP
ncbi:transporter substrate-binding domain-containing protein [Sulfuricurvum sp.]|uniref:substrate-binding periplasmic protein n=2 Tax=Sulfuricurvum sp. TaxID=2025608 RepID=UPI002632848F|nr:transporter substrate-binding domain-containing protein [Sulfuricurvum sp.]MDD2266753.1 transporter substrate-binding domain-containing protein [Sulfuricurvum sp.]MDD2784576.1 transporter substrate-binding domain-containing protein [Sulfuricurvum sp.]